MTKLVPKILSLLTIVGLIATIGATPAVSSIDEHGRSESDLRMEEFLRTAKLIGSEEVGEGITKPLQLQRQVRL
jgi:hypothetical protein